MGEEVKQRVQIRSRTDMTIYDKDQMPVPTKEIMYTTQFLMPGIIRIPIAEYTLDEEAKHIRADIEKRLTERPEVQEV